MEADPCKFILTSRTTSSSVESYVLHSSHPGVREVWTFQIGQMLESQRNFLNGEHGRKPEHRKEIIASRAPLSLSPL